MLAVLHSEVFQIAQPSIDLLQRLVRADIGADSRLTGQPAALGGFEDELGEPLAAAAVQPIGLRIFVDEALELARIAGQFRPHQRRRQVAERHSRDTALGLRGLARIADDEGIDHQHRADDDFREARRRQRHGLARQPFERAVSAHVNDGISLEMVTQPEPKG